MITNATPLPSDVKLCHEIIRKLNDSMQGQQRQIEQLEHRLDRLLQQRYGRKSERREGPTLFDLDQLCEPSDETSKEKPAKPEAIEVKSHTRKRGGGRKPLPAHLPRREKLHDVPEAERTCDCCGESFKRIGQETSEQLDYEPASLFVVVHVRPKYAKTCGCEIDRPVRIAEKPIEPIDKGVPGAGLLAAIGVNKYADHLPLYRQSHQTFKREGIVLPESSSCRWMGVVGDLACSLVDLMRLEVLKSYAIHTDDTPVNMRLEGGGMKRAHFWPYVGDADHPYIVYDFTTDHNGAGPRRFLGDYAGYIHCDATSIYDELFAPKKPENFRERLPIEVSCWGHARRKFVESERTDALRSVEGVARIRLLYKIEQRAKSMTAEARGELRRLESVPIIESFFQWCETQQRAVLPKSPIGMAVSYALNNRTALKRYVEDGRLTIDNLTAERAIRGLAIGRRNWLFVGNERGGHTAAILFSLLAGARRHNIDPWRYLRDIFTRLADLKPGELPALLPDNWAKANGQIPAAE